MNPLPRNDLKDKYPRRHYNKRGKTKQIFESIESAKNYIYKMNLKDYTIYLCTECNKYHISHK